MKQQKIRLHKVKVHNLKSIDLTLTPNQLIVFTGVSGSGKSSLAFDTIYIEGQRRYVESLSNFARRQLGDMTKPDAELITGISPTISIEQKTAGRNPRSTVGTMTEVYDYLRVLYARVGIPHCPVSGEAVMPQSRERIIKTVQHYPLEKKIVILSPYAKGKKAEFKEDFRELLRKGFMRVRVDGNILNLTDEVILDGNVAHDVEIVIDRLKVEPDHHSRIAESLNIALEVGNGECAVLDVEAGDEELFSMHAYSPKSGLSYSSLEPHDFSFNTPLGMCPRCHGLGEVKEFNLDLVIDPKLSIAEDCCSVASSYQTVRYGNIYRNLAEIYNFDVHMPWKLLPQEAKEIFLYGIKKKWTRMHFVHPETGAHWMDYVHWKGVLHEAHARYEEAKSDSYQKKMEKLMHRQTCPECHGERLKPYPAATLLEGKRISQIALMTIGESLQFFRDLKLAPQEEMIAEELLKEIKERLHFLEEVGLHYLTLDRSAPTLSGGESQRVRLASQIGSGLVGITYILDEPSIGLHPRDNHKLITTLKHLRDLGNTVIVVEHDEETIWSADHILDLGPGPGVKGGEIVVDGSLKDLLTSERSITGDYLTGRKAIAIPKKRRKKKKVALELSGVQHHNLKDVKVKIPLSLFVAVTGVSGSGKSSLITEVLYPLLANALHRADHEVGKHKAIKGLEHIDKVIAIDQLPIGRNPRSNPATYIKLFDEIRDLFSKLPESQARGFLPGRFSFNVKEGSCSQCDGMGMIKIDMDFLEDEWVVCPLCEGKRFDPETLAVMYKGKTIYDILDMEVAEALKFFENIPSINHKLKTLHRVGMDYIKLGQSSTTLSGGEAQRIKLAKELVRPSTSKTLYILDEPTTGLHFHDIKHLLDVLHHLVDQGNSVLVIEHNMDIVKTADWIIDLGPEGGWQGGEIVGEGPPEKIAKMDTATGEALTAILYEDRQKKVEEALLVQQKDEATTQSIQRIIVEGASQHNLKGVNLEIPRQEVTIFTGPSGSGKSSLAFDTLYAEGQRRYIESLSPYARQFVKQMPKPKVTFIEGLSPAIAIEQKAHAGNPRSTVGTMTEIYDYLRILFARVGIPHDPETGEEIKSISKEFVVQKVLSYPAEEKIQVLAPIKMRKGEAFQDVLARLSKLGFVRIRLNKDYYTVEGNEIPYDPKRKNELFLIIDRLKIDLSIEKRLFEAIEIAAKFGDNKIVITRQDQDILFNLAFAIESTGKSFPEINPHTFSFNAAEGMCPDCQGLGYQYGVNLFKNEEVLYGTVGKLIKFLWSDEAFFHLYDIFENILKTEGIKYSDHLHVLTAKQLRLLLNGSDQWITSKQGFQYRWVGLNDALAKAAKGAYPFYREKLLPLLEEITCYSCQGTRLNPLARHVTIEGQSIQDVCQMPIEKTLLFIQNLAMKEKKKTVLQEVYHQLQSRFRFLAQVGLHYISLDRKAPTLSGGEAQRIRLARQLGSGLTGVMYVLDEPTIGLHPHDNAQLNSALGQLRDLGNTLIMVEHDPQTIATADYLYDFGPGSGDLGGHITAHGTFEQILQNENSLTGAYLSKKKQIPIPSKRRPLNKGTITIENASAHNLKNLNLEIPIGVMNCLTGVSGSGKSSLLEKVILPAFDSKYIAQNKVSLQFGTVSGIHQFEKVINIDQNPVGHTVRSDVGTYADVLTPIRYFFASLPAAATKGLLPQHFSYNHRRGMCSACWGLGYKKVEMHFLPPVKVICEDCHGLRLNPLSLEVRYKGKNLGEYLDTTVQAAREVFENHRNIVRILDTLISVGLGYLKLGQEVATLSGGEAQRLKLSRELSKRSRGKTLYLLDEPTTGLHSDDILKLMAVLNKLTDKGNTLILIEHNMDVIKCVDHIIDLGPEAGDKGGEIVCQGTPEEVALNSISYTAKYLQRVLAES